MLIIYLFISIASWGMRSLFLKAWFSLNNPSLWGSYHCYKSCPTLFLYSLAYFSLELIFEGSFFLVLPLDNVIYMQLWPCLKLNPCWCSPIISMLIHVHATWYINIHNPSLHRTIYCKKTCKKSSAFKTILSLTMCTIYLGRWSIGITFLDNLSQWCNLHFNQEFVRYKNYTKIRIRTLRNSMQLETFMWDAYIYQCIFTYHFAYVMQPTYH